MALKARFCAKCGKETDVLMHGMCARCSKEEMRVSLPGPVSLTICSKCGAIRWQGIWSEPEHEPEFYIKQLVASKVRLPEEAELASLEILELGKPGEVKLVIRVMNELMTETRKIGLAFKKTICTDCAARYSGKDYLAMIQVRGADKGRVMKIINEFGKKISQIKEQEKGLDISFWNKLAANDLARILNKKLDLRMSRSSKAYSWRRTESKPKYQDVYKLEPAKLSSKKQQKLL